MFFFVCQTVIPSNMRASVALLQSRCAKSPRRLVRKHDTLTANALERRTRIKARPELTQKRTPWYPVRAMERPLVFLSCGQRVDHEIELGRRICDLIAESGYEPFFAQRRSDLRGLSEVIFASLEAAGAYIAVVHRRESIDAALARYRGSLFVEQELAVAAYIRRSKDLPVLFYVQNGVERGGVRSTLLLNASFSDREAFENDSEVLEHLRLELPRLRISPAETIGTNLKLETISAWATDGSNNLTINIYARNLGTVLPSRVELHVSVPTEFNLPVNLPGRKGRDSTGEFELIVRHPYMPDMGLDPERPNLLFTLPVPRFHGLTEKKFKFRLIAEGQRPQEILSDYRELCRTADLALPSAT